MVAISLKNIYKSFIDENGNKIDVLNNINLDIEMGEFFILVGPSGSGKSTLLRIASGLEKSYRGEVKLGDEISSADLSFVFQQFALLPWLSVQDNIALGLKARHMPEAKQKPIVAKELEVFKLEKFAKSHPHELSGGMRQRVGIARALATSPKIIFMDEPFSELDSFTAEELRQEILKIWQERRPTIIMVSHIIEEALELADRIAVLTARPGRVEKVVTNHLNRPRQKRSQEFYNFEDQLHHMIKPS